MRTATDRLPQDPPGTPALEETVRLLAEELAVVRGEAERRRRHRRLMLPALAPVAVLAGWWVQTLFPSPS
jgi:hypothetical protein